MLSPPLLCFIVSVTIQLVYFDTQTNDTRGVVDLSSVSITRGPEDNKLKCLKKFPTPPSSSSPDRDKKRRVQDEVMTAFSLLLITDSAAGCSSNTSANSATGVNAKEKKQRFELVFATIRAAKMFCFAVYCVHKDSAVLVRYPTGRCPIHLNCVLLLCSACVSVHVTWPVNLINSTLTGFHPL